MKNKYDLSIGMIVKNEEKYLEKCLTALLPLKELITCEIIVTDTGSTDKTVEIAEKYADTVLHFEWCDDFAKARNTGVEVAQGDWFMYVDADEFLDESLVRIAEFIKSEDRDTYDQATVIVRNFTDNELKKYNDMPLKRLFNFTNGNRLFEGEICEFIPVSNEIFSVKSIALHYGYIPVLLSEKKTRNRKLLEQEYEESPNDLRIIKLLSDCVENYFQVLLLKRAIDIIDSCVDNNYEGIQNNEYIFVVFCALAYNNIIKGENDLTIKTCEQYFITNLIKENVDKASYPTLEIYFMLSVAYYQKKEYGKALENFLIYQKMFDELKLNNNHFLESAYKYNFNTEMEYEKSGHFLMEIYKANNDKENLFKYLDKSSMYKFALKDEVLINAYIQKVILYEKKDLYEKAMNYFNSNDLIQECEKLESVLVAKIYFDYDLSYFVSNYSIPKLNKTLKWAYKHTHKIKDKFYDILSKDIEVNDLKELKVYIQIAYFYLFSEIDSLSKNDVDMEFRKKIDDIFNLYVESVLYYLNELYTPVMLQSQNLELLNKEEGMCVVLGGGFQNRDNDRVGYIKALKEALKYNESFKYIILNSISVIENQIPEVTVEPENNEFELLAVKIKQTISNLILSKEFEQAKSVLEQYRTINPTDPDIDKFLKLMI